MKLAKALILIVWLIMLGLLIHRHHSHDGVEPISFASVEDILELKEAWMGIYMHGEKIGYAFSSFKRVGDRYEISEHSLMYLTLGGTKQRIESRLKASVDLHFALSSFSFSLTSAGTNYSLDGVVDDGRLEMTIASGKHTSEKTIPLPSNPFLSNTARPYLISRGIEVGKQYRLPFFDPSTMTNSELVVTVQGIENLSHQGKNIKAYRLSESFKGLTATAWLTEDGSTIKEESPLGIMLVREDQQTALSGKWTTGTTEDLIITTSVPVSRKIVDPRTVGSLTVKLRNVSLQDFDLDGCRQRLEGREIHIHREPEGAWSTFTLPYQGNAAIMAFAEPSPLIQSNHVRIIDQAREATKGSLDAERSARLLLSWVYNYLDKEPTVSVPSALEVLDIRAGDCNEHAALYTALCRALGLPTRICAGLLYLNGSFFYHAWAEVYLGTWVAVDPSLNQFPADATHIRLVVGDLTDQIKLLNLVGTLELTVIDYS